MADFIEVFYAVGYAYALIGLMLGLVMGWLGHFFFIPRGRARLMTIFKRQMHGVFYFLSEGRQFVEVVLPIEETAKFGNDSVTVLKKHAVTSMRGSAPLFFADIKRGSTLDLLSDKPTYSGGAFKCVCGYPNNVPDVKGDEKLEKTMKCAKCGKDSLIELKYVTTDGLDAAQVDGGIQTSVAVMEARRKKEFGKQIGLLIAILVGGLLVLLAANYFLSSGTTGVCSQAAGLAGKCAALLDNATVSVVKP